MSQSDPHLLDKLASIYAEAVVRELLAKPFDQNDLPEGSKPQEDDR